MSTVQIDLTSKVPHYEQLRAQLAALISSGALRDGQRLPTVRALANDLAIAPGTVARTYRDLETSGLVTTRRRVGTVVTAPRAARERDNLIRCATDLARLAAEHSVSDADLHDIVAAALVATRQITQPDDEPRHVRARPHRASAVIA